MSALVRPPNEGRVAFPLAEPVRNLPLAERVLSAIMRRWRMLALMAVVGGLGGLAVGRFMPPWYESTATFAVIPIDDPTGPANISDNAGAALPLFTHVLTSRRVLDETVARLNLTDVYGQSSLEATRNELLHHVSVSSDRKANVVVFTVEDRLPPRARLIASTMGQIASDVNTEIWSARGSEHRKRLEMRFAEVSRALASAEEAMRQFREREHVVDLPEQVRASVTEAAHLERLKTEKRIGLRFAQGFGGAESAEVRKSQLEAGTASAALQGLVHGHQQRGPLLALDELPRLEREHARLKREIDTNAATYELLSKQVEQLRAVAARPGGRPELVDPPTESVRRSRPSRAMLTVEGSMLGVLLGLLLVVRPRSLAMVSAITLPRKRLDAPPR